MYYIGQLLGKNKLEPFLKRNLMKNTIYKTIKHQGKIAKILYKNLSPNSIQEMINISSANDWSTNSHEDKPPLFSLQSVSPPKSGKQTLSQIVSV